MGTFLIDSGRDLKAAYFTLGCKLNYAETSTIGRHLKSCGIADASPSDTPDICVINTCSVTETADKKARSLIRRVVRKYPEAFVVVTGCYAQLKPEEIAAIEGVDLILGSKEKLHIVDYLGDLRKEKSARIATGKIGDTGEFSPSCSRGDRARFFLKVQDGCDYFCSYCTIPYARGRSRSGRIADLVHQAEKAAREGGKEIVLTGVNIGDFGKNTGESFEELVRALDVVEGIERFRISSIEPNLITDSIIEWVARESQAFMPHFHIPLQSGSDAVLKKMNRRYDTALFAEKINKIKSLIPDAFIGVDVIAGARGESPEEWEKAYSFIEGLPVSRLHVFPYSERPGTAALHIDEIVSQQEKNRRAAELIALSDRKMKSFMEENIGRERPVLWEHKVKGTDLITGLTDNYLRVVAPGSASHLNTITPASLTAIDPSRPETLTGITKN